MTIEYFKGSNDSGNNNNTDYRWLILNRQYFGSNHFKQHFKRIGSIFYGKDDFYGKKI